MKGTVILLNVSIMTGGPGIYAMRKSTVDEFRKIWSGAETKISAIGHEATAQLFSVILGETVQVNRINAAQESGDVALVLKMKSRLPEGTVLTEMSQLEEIGYELFVMERIERKLVILWESIKGFHLSAISTEVCNIRTVRDIFKGMAEKLWDIIAIRE